MPSQIFNQARHSRAWFALGPRPVILTRLQVRQLRCIAEVELAPAPGLNVLIGTNGAGKSSLIEAVHLLGYGRSFRGRVADGLIRRDAPHLEVYAEWRDAAGTPHRAGLRNGSNYSAPESAEHGVRLV